MSPGCAHSDGSVWGVDVSHEVPINNQCDLDSNIDGELYPPWGVSSGCQMETSDYKREPSMAMEDENPNNLAGDLVTYSSPPRSG